MSDRPLREGLSDDVVALRTWSEADAPAIVECIDGDDEITRWLDQIPQPYALEKAGFRLEGVLRAVDWSPRQQRRLDWAMYSLLPGELE